MWVCIFTLGCGAICLQLHSRAAVCKSQPVLLLLCRAQMYTEGVLRVRNQPKVRPEPLISHLCPRSSVLSESKGFQKKISAENTSDPPLALLLLQPNSRNFSLALLCPSGFQQTQMCAWALAFRVNLSGRDLLLHYLNSTHLGGFWNGVSLVQGEIQHGDLTDRRAQGSFALWSSWNSSGTSLSAFPGFTGS